MEVSRQDDTTLVMKLFDVNRDGSISVSELENVLSALDPDSWTPERLRGLIATFDKNGDGDLQFTEFWGWINGHGGPPHLDEQRESLLQKAIESDEANRMRARQRKEQAHHARVAREAQEAEAARKKQERLSGARLTREAFISKKMEAGLTREVAQEMYNAADDDRDGDVDQEELGRLAQNAFATTAQVKQVFQKGAVGEASNVVVKSCSDSGIQSIVDAFSTWDSDGDGTITSEELGSILKKLNPRFTEVTVGRMMDEIDTNDDGVIDIHEFIAWLNGENVKKKKMKKKAKEEQDAKLAAAMHQKRAQEARAGGFQLEFETMRHGLLPAWCTKTKQQATCGTLNTGPHARAICTGCNGRHGWLCHGCGFVCFMESCINNCPSGIYGWSCLYGRCKPKKCGCKKKLDFWRRCGFVGTLSTVSADIDNLLQIETGAAAAASSSPTAGTGDGD